MQQSVMFTRHGFITIIEFKSSNRNRRNGLLIAHLAQRNFAINDKIHMYISIEFYRTRLAPVLDEYVPFPKASSYLKHFFYFTLGTSPFHCQHKCTSNHKLNAVFEELALKRIKINLGGGPLPGYPGWPPPPPGGPPGPLSKPVPKRRNLIFISFSSLETSHCYVPDL